MNIYTRQYGVSEASEYINWLYFFHAWGFPASYASIAKVHGCVSCRQTWLGMFPDSEKERAKEAVQLYDEACRLLSVWNVSGLQTLYRVRLLKANGHGEDILLPEEGMRIPLLRQQHPASAGPCLCLSDFVSPVGTGETDMIGVFVSTTDKGMLPSPGDDYITLLSQTLADRLAEATSELGHLQTRRQWWGYAQDEHLGIDELFKECYQGKRPAVGYPSLPDQSICFILSDLLDFPSIGVSLTESGAMIPHASTCGLLLSHPATCHFSVGAVGEDQLRDYARRRGLGVEELRRFLVSL